MPRSRAETARRRFGIRLRVVLTATIVVAAALGISGVSLVLLLQQSLVSSLDAGLGARSEDITSLAAAGSLPATISNAGEESSLVQVVDSSNTVIAATNNVQGQEPILASPPARPGIQSVVQVPVGSGQFRVSADTVQLPGGKGWVYVAASLSQVESAVGNLTILFAVGLPLVLLVVVGALWRAVGQVLHPVEAIRLRASTIGGADLSQRVPVPSSGDEIASLATTMNEMLERLESASRRQGQFLGDASHELRSPLAALRTQVDVALAHPEAPGSADVLARVQEQVARMSTLIDDLLFLARSTEAAPHDLTGVVDLDELLIAELHRLRENDAPAVELLSVQAARVRGSERDIARLLRNLGDNAREHAESTIALGLAVTGGSAEFTVEDDGAGIPVQDRERVFERFTRLDEARARTTHGGAGVGLAIARQIVEDHGGTIAITDRADGAAGAVFVVRLPLSPVQGTG
jgi:signal transduction histidine kinase